MNEAEHRLRAVMRDQPGLAAAHAELAQLLQRDGRAGEALAMLDARTLELPNAVWPLTVSAAVLDAERRVLESLPVHEEIVRRVPEVSVVWLNYGHALASLGRTGEAAAAYRRSLALDPASGMAWWALARLSSVPLEPDDVQRLRQALQDARDHHERMEIHFALGRALEQAGDHEESFEHYTAGNRFRASLISPASREAVRIVRQSASLLTRRFLDEHSDDGCDAGDPIFIVGMPRSGSTLVEQILASHPLVEGMGELSQLQDIAADLGAGGSSWLDGIAGLAPAEFKALGERYVEATRRYRKTDRPYFTDKLPANWLLVGLIQLILPRARIIDVRREPMACCFANFSFYFNRRTSLAAGLVDLGRHYRDYVRYMAWFDEVRPGRVRRISYEALAEDLGGEARRLLADLGLAFDPDVLQFFDHERAVHTPSADQVRRPLMPDRNLRWRHYERWLGPLRQALAS